jgi:VanZ family protein
MFTRRIFWRVCACAWAVQIYLMSASPALSSDHTRSWLARFLVRWFHWSPPESTLRLLGLLLRKTAHVGEYALLAFLIFQALQALREPASRRAVWSFALTAAYALSDEIHQIFVPGRGASLTDWAIDLTGGIAATVVLYSLRPLPRLRAKPS